MRPYWHSSQHEYTGAQREDKETAMIETLRLIIQDRQSADIRMEQHYAALFPQLLDLDPTVGESRNPIFLSLFEKEENRHIGSCSLYNFTNTEVEFGVRIFIPEYWNKGYGCEVVNALCEYVFNCFPQIMTVLAKTPVYNTRAIRCYEKCNFREYSRAILDGYDMVFMRRLRCLLQRS